MTERVSVRELEDLTGITRGQARSIERRELHAASPDKQDGAVGVFVYRLLVILCGATALGAALAILPDILNTVLPEIFN